MRNWLLWCFGEIVSKPVVELVEWRTKPVVEMVEGRTTPVVELVEWRTKPVAELVEWRTKPVVELVEWRTKPVVELVELRSLLRVVRGGGGAYSEPLIGEKRLLRWRHSCCHLAATTVAIEQPQLWPLSSHSCGHWAATAVAIEQPQLFRNYTKTQVKKKLQLTRLNIKFSINRIHSMEQEWKIIDEPRLLHDAEQYQIDWFYIK